MFMQIVRYKKITSCSRKRKDNILTETVLATLAYTFLSSDLQLNHLKMKTMKR